MVQPEDQALLVGEEIPTLIFLGLFDASFETKVCFCIHFLKKLKKKTVVWNCLKYFIRFDLRIKKLVTNKRQKHKQLAGPKIADVNKKGR